MAFKTILPLCFRAKSLQSCLTLCDLMDRRPPSSSVHRILQARILKGCYVLLQGIFLTQGSNLGLLHCRWILSPPSQPLLNPQIALFPWPCPWTLDSHLSKHSVSLHHFHLKFDLNPNISCISNLPFSKVNSNLGPLVSESINSWFFHFSDSSGQILESPRTLSFSSLWLQSFNSIFLAQLLK